MISNIQFLDGLFCMTPIILLGLHDCISIDSNTRG